MIFFFFLFFLHSRPLSYYCCIVSQILKNNELRNDFFPQVIVILEMTFNSKTKVKANLFLVFDLF